MAAVLVITRDKIQLEKVAIDTTPFVIGRSSGCNLTLNDGMLSREHCEIDEAVAGFTLQDKASRNGTQINGNPVEGGPTPLADGDRLTVGPFELAFYSSGGEDLPAAEEEDAATRFVGADPAAQNAKKKGKEKKAEPVSAGTVVEIEVSSGPVKGNAYKDWRGDLIIGRGSESDIILPDDAVSTRHARVYKDPEGRYYVEDFGSSNGTFVDNVRIRERTLLKNGASIRIGTTVMDYSEVDPVLQKANRKKIIIAAAAVVLVLLVVKMLKPEDPTIRYIAQGQAFLSEGNYTNAMAAFQRALDESPGNNEATLGFNTANDEKKASELLEKAKEAALQEQYAEAEDICNEVLRYHAGNEEAKEMLAVLEMVKESKIAADARNWPDAIRLMETALAREEYADSEVLQSGLARAQSESRAEMTVTNAASLIAAKNYAEAGAELRDIQEASDYYAEAQAQLEQLEKLVQADNAYRVAAEAFLGGDEEMARRHIVDGLEFVPGYPDLVKLRDDIQIIAPMKKRLDSGGELLGSTDVDAMLEMVGECAAIMNMGIDSAEIKSIQTDASEFSAQLQERLRLLADEAFREGNKELARGNRQGAMQQFNLASKADPVNERAQEAADRLRRELAPLAKEHFQQAMVHEELGQIELAIIEYKNVMNIAIKGDSYYDRSETRLKRLEE